jgi:Starch-binding associating with outer membrane
MTNKFKIYTLSVLLSSAAFFGCKKGTFDINSVNPNSPSDVSPKFILAGALAGSASNVRGGDADFAQLYMGYWAVSGDFIPVTSTLTYQTTTSYYSDNWDGSYLLLKNYRQMEELAVTDPNLTYYVAIGKIMEAFHFERLVDMYNNVPYKDALTGGVVNYPKFDNGIDVYKGLLAQLDTAIQLINTAPATASLPGTSDIMFGKSGNEMQLWIQFANTVKLKTVMNLTQYQGGTTIITDELKGLGSSSFLGVGQDAGINPGYSSASNGQQSPFYQDMGFQTNGSPSGNESYYRACSYAVDYMYKTNDTLRLYQIYAPASATGVVKGRPFGSETSLNQNNVNISGMGPGLLKTSKADAIIFPGTESLFLQAEATLKGYLPGGAAVAASLYQQAVEESFRLLEVPDYQNAADDFISTSSDPNVNISISGNPLQTIIMQEWVALNGFDPVQTWNNWKRLGIPSDLPISKFGGTTAPHVPYRLLYSQTEYQYNTANVSAQGPINNITSKIFWMP